MYELRVHVEDQPSIVSSRRVVMFTLIGYSPCDRCIASNGEEVYIGIFNPRNTISIYSTVWIEQIIVTFVHREANLSK